MQSKKKRKWFQNKDAIAGLLFLSPWLIGVIWFFARELFMAVQYSFSEMIVSEGGYTLNFVGLDNFKYALLEDPDFNKTLVDSLKDILIQVPLIIFFSLFMAMILNGKFKLRTMSRAILFLPIIMRAGAIGDTLAMAMTAANGGVESVASELESAASSGVNVEYFLSLFTAIGFPATLINYIVSAVSEIYDIVQLSGIQIIIFIAALQSISTSHYEVAKIEGATGYETFWKVTLPMVSPLILTNVIYTIVDSFVDSPVVEKAYEMAFAQFDWGISVAMSLLSSVSVCIILLIVGVVISRKVFYHN